MVDTSLILRQFTLNTHRLGWTKGTGVLTLERRPFLQTHFTLEKAIG